MTPLKVALERFGHYLQAIPVNSGMSVDEEMTFAKFCVVSECEQILQTNPTIKGNSEDLITMIVQTKAFYCLVIKAVNDIK